MGGAACPAMLTSVRLPFSVTLVHQCCEARHDACNVVSANSLSG